MRKPVSWILFGVVICILSSCAQPPPRHDCPPESLIINETVFPEGVVAGIPMSPLPDGGGTSIGRDLSSEGESGIHVSHDVYPYKTSEGAAKEFESELNRPSDQEMMPYDLSNLQLRADQHAFLCSPTEIHPRCKYIARYDNYYIWLILRTGSLDTPVEVLIPAIEDIDRRMMRCFEEHPAP